MWGAADSYPAPAVSWRAGGGGFGLCLDGRDGAVTVDAQQLRRHLAPFAGMVRLIVLAACDSANAGALGSQLGSVAQSLHRCGFQAVIASRYPLSVEGSCMLTAGFYQHLLGEPASVESAFLAARQQLALAETGQAAERRRLTGPACSFMRGTATATTRGRSSFGPTAGCWLFSRKTSGSSLVGARDPRSPDRPAGPDRSGARPLSDRRRRIGDGQVVAGAGRGGAEVPGSRSCAALHAHATGQRSAGRAARCALSWQPGTAGVLLVDQLEEIFTQTASPTQRESFVARLWELASEPGACTSC